ncbi:hypothetical protein D3880_03625 [Pseudomonas cavernae]|uniref:Lipoprotein n=1 Tax=Pseudomonas cavernae TaxID=2320867 RepID=A0A385YXB1_9PSED|nr:hypothetical protein [Pseudomonas cavernae]AYC31539.1 hypothetical protein D3880_03625 [Pseudomonas cavernae]
MHYAKLLSLSLLVASLAACSSTTPSAPVAAAKPAASALNNEDWYQVRTETQLFLFDDYQVFRDFVATGKAPVIKDTELKDAKSGLPIAVALRAEDQAKPLAQTAAYQFLTVALTPAEKFYGEIRQDGHIYVFSRYGDMVDMNKIGEPTFSFNDIGGGPQGERVVYVLAKEEPKPVKQIALFNTKYK